MGCPKRFREDKPPLPPNDARPYQLLQPLVGRSSTRGGVAEAGKTTVKPELADGRRHIESAHPLRVRDDSSYRRNHMALSPAGARQPVQPVFGKGLAVSLPGHYQLYRRASC